MFLKIWKIEHSNDFQKMKLENENRKYFMKHTLKFYYCSLDFYIYKLLTCIYLVYIQLSLWQTGIEIRNMSKARNVYKNELGKKLFREEFM